jgi:HAMP domain-containing protein
MRKSELASRILFDLQYSARSFSRTPGLSLVLLLTIALGIGSNASVSGFVRGLTKRSSPLAGVDRVVSIFGRDSRGEAGPISFADYLDLRANADAFEWIGAARVTRGAVKLAGQEAIRTVAAVTPELAGSLGLPTDERVSSHELEGLYVGQPVDVWAPLGEEQAGGGDAGARNVWVIAKLRPGAPMKAGDYLVLPYTGMTPQTADGYARAGLVLWIAAGAVFFIACANTASFLLGRATSRSHETSLRVALGASQSQIARQLLSDSILLAVTGGLLGLLLAVWTSRIVPALLFAGDAERLVFVPEITNVAVASAFCVCITILCGLMPLIAIPHARPAAVLRRESTGPSPLVGRVRTGIVIAQLACCCTLATSTAFLVAGLRSAVRTSAGRELGDSILATVQSHPDVGLPYFQRIESVARDMKAVRETAWVGVPPGGQPTWMSFRIEPRQLPLREITMDAVVFSPPMVELFRLPPAAGRMFGVVDRGCRVAIVNEEAAAGLFGRETAGRSIQDPAGQPVEVIGVVAHRAAALQRPSIFYYESPGVASLGNIVAGRFQAVIASGLQRAELAANVVSPNYFESTGSLLTAGTVNPDKTKRRGCRTAVINQEAADLYFGGSAVGAAVIENNGRRTEITGVVRSSLLGTFQRREEPVIYFPMVQDVLPRMTIVLRTQNGELVDEVLRRFEAVDGRGPAPIVVKSLETHLRETSLAPLRIVAVISGASTAIALLLGLLGLYGTLSDSARQRGRELAIRIALGARRRHVIGHVLRDGGRLAAAGALAGLAGSLVIARLLAPITPVDYSPALWVWMAGPVVLAVAVTIAGVLPARRASMADPLMLLRDNN